MNFLSNNFSLNNLRGYFFFLSVMVWLLLLCPVAVAEETVVEPVEITAGAANDKNDVENNSVVDKSADRKTQGVSIFHAEGKADRKIESSAGNSYMLQLFSGLIIVLLCIVVLAWFAKRFTGLQSSANSNLRIVEGISMGARERIVVVQAGSERLLLGVSPGRINMLHVLAEDDVNESSLQVDKEAVSNKENTFSRSLASAISRSES